MGEGEQTVARVDSVDSDLHPQVRSCQRLEIICWLGIPQGKNQPGRGATQVRR